MLTGINTVILQEPALICPGSLAQAQHKPRQQDTSIQTEVSITAELND